jgi:chromosome segregation ATPase
MSEEHGFSDEHRQQVTQSFESIVRIVLGEELRALRQSIDDVDSRLTERVESVVDGTGARIDQIRDQLVPGLEELRSKVDEAAQTRERSMADLDDRLTQATSSVKDEMHAVAEGLEEPKREIATLSARLEDSRREIEALREELSESKQANATLMEAAGKTEDEIEALRRDLQRPTEQIEILNKAVEEPKQQLQSLRDELRSLTDRLQEMNEQSDNRIEVVKATLEQEIAGGDASLMEQLNALVGDFNQLQEQMTRQTQTSQHLSGVLNNLASIFTSQRGGQPSAAMPEMPKEPVAVSTAKPEVRTEAPETSEASDDTRSIERDVPAREGGNNELENALNRVFPLES